MKLYYHKTSGGAEYLTDRWIRNPNGTKEGCVKNARFIVRIDGDITKDAELIVAGMPEKKKQVVVSVCGGVADTAYASRGVEVVIVDFDNHEGENDCDDLLSESIAKAKKNER